MKLLQDVRLSIIVMLLVLGVVTLACVSPAEVPAVDPTSEPPAPEPVEEVELSHCASTAIGGDQPYLVGWLGQLYPVRAYA